MRYAVVIAIRQKLLLAEPELNRVLGTKREWGGIAEKEIGARKQTLGIDSKSL